MTKGDTSQGGGRFPYSDFVRKALTEPERSAADGMEWNRYMSGFARKYLEVGRRLGEAFGKARGKTEALFAVLRARDLRVSEDERSRIVDCPNLARLDRWIVGAVSGR